MGRKSEAKKQLIQVAIQLIWEHSYNTVSVDKLCKQANVNKGSFYYFFPSKCALALEALDTAWESVRQEVYDPAFLHHIPPLERFPLFFKNLYKLQKKALKQTGHVLGCPFGNLGSEAGIRDNNIRSKIKDIFSDQSTYFENALRDALKEGLIESEDVSTLAQSLTAYVGGVILHAKVQNNVELFRKFLPGALRLIRAKEVKKNIRGKKDFLL
jgi:TetR/AcrR family transcriptional repressor of nem operon|tara:strand:+ start:7774 stop:8412 length:639 start_codon:yes stop_codon:yes gene_type:complete